MSSLAVDEFPCRIHLTDIMGMLIMGRQRLNIIVPFFRYQDLVLFQKFPGLFFCQDLPKPFFVIRPFREGAQRKQAPVMYESQHISVQVFPCPVEPGKLAEHGIPGADVVPGIVTGKPDGILSFPPHMKRQVHGILRHRARLVACHEYLDFRSLIHMYSLKPCSGEHGILSGLPSLNAVIIRKNPPGFMTILLTSLG